MPFRKRFVAIVSGAVFVVPLLLLALSIGLSVRGQYATVKAIRASGGLITSFWLPGESGLQRSDWFLRPSWYLSTFTKQPRGIGIDEQTDLSVLELLRRLPTVERIFFSSPDFSSTRGKNIIRGLASLPRITNLAWINGKNMSRAKSEFSELTHVEVAGILRPKGDGCASLSIVEAWLKLRVLLIIEASICENDLTYPTPSLTDLRIAACRFAPGEFRNLGRFSNLRRLSLYETEIPDFNINVLGSLRELQELELSTARVDEADVRHLINELPSLRELVLPFDWSEERISAMRLEFPGVAIWRCKADILQSFWDRPPIDEKGNAMRSDVPMKVN